MRYKQPNRGFRKGGLSGSGRDRSAPGVANMRNLAKWWAVPCLLVAPAVRAGEWPGWRGPRGDGVSDEKNIPVRWGKKDNIHWKVAVPGRGYSSPVIWGDRIFLATCLEK